MAPSARTSTLRSINGWLDQRRPWHYALIAACVMTAAATGGTAITQWLLHGHLDLSALIGTAAGSAIGAFTIAFSVQLTRHPRQ